MILFIVGKTTNKAPGVWDFHGVFSTEEKAVEACASNLYFISKEELDENVLESAIFSETRWPHSEVPEQRIWAVDKRIGR